MSAEHQRILATHKMEQRANVYLRLSPTGDWVVDSVFTQKGPCDGLDDVDEQGCSCNDFGSAEHRTAIALANQVELPGPDELLRLMVAALYPHDTPPDLTSRANIETWLADPNTKGPWLT